MVVNTLQSRRGRRKEEMAMHTLQPRRGRRKEEMAIDTLKPRPMLIPVDDNDLKSLELSVDVVAPESAFLIGGDTALTVDVSDLPQRTEGGVTGQTETASRSPSTTRL